MERLRERTGADFADLWELSVENVDDKLKRIGHSLSTFKVDRFRMVSVGSVNDKLAYRTSVEQFPGGRMLCISSGGKPPFLTCNLWKLELFQ